MDTSLPLDTNKRDIALQYLGICAKKLTTSNGDYDEALAQVRALKHYLELAKQYGCTEREIVLALGFSPEKRAALVGA